MRNSARIAEKAGLSTVSTGKAIQDALNDRQADAETMRSSG
jgi:hypothetical protein